MSIALDLLELIRGERQPLRVVARPRPRLGLDFLKKPGAPRNPSPSAIVRSQPYTFWLASSIGPRPARMLADSELGYGLACADSVVWRTNWSSASTNSAATVNITTQPGNCNALTTATPEGMAWGVAVVQMKSAAAIPV